MSRVGSKRSHHGLSKELRLPASTNAGVSAFQRCTITTAARTTEALTIYKPYTETTHYERLTKQYPPIPEHVEDQLLEKERTWKSTKFRKSIHVPPLEGDVFKLRRFIFEYYATYVPKPNKSKFAKIYLMLLEDIHHNEELKAFPQRVHKKVIKSLVTADHSHWMPPPDQRLKIKELGIRVLAERQFEAYRESIKQSDKRVEESIQFMINPFPDADNSNHSDVTTVEQIMRRRDERGKSRDERPIEGEWSPPSGTKEGALRKFEKNRVTIAEVEDYDGWSAFDDSKSADSSADIWSSFTTDVIERKEKQEAFLHGRAVQIDPAHEKDRRIKYEISYAPLVALDVLKIADKGSLPQYALLGSLSGDLTSTSNERRLGDESSDFSFFNLAKRNTDDVSESLEKDVDRRLFLNTNAPTSTFICGLQGSGKSHTLACILGKTKNFFSADTR